jgi:hypothetical protein
LNTKATLGTLRPGTGGNGETYERAPANTNKEEASTATKYGIDEILVEEIDARKKLQEAAYFLGKMKDFETQGLANEFIYHFDGFLAAWYSIIDDTILYDYAHRFKLPFTREDRMTRDDFALAARVLKERGEEEPTKFVAWLNNEIKEMRKKHDLLFKSRHVVIHRGIVPIGGKTVEKKTAYATGASYSIRLVESISLASQAQAGSIPPAAETPDQPSTAQQQPEAIIKYATFENLFYFMDDPKGRRVIDVCESAHKDMDILLTEAQIEAWKKT